LALGIILVVATLSVSRLAVHTQRKLAAMDVKDPVIDAFVWIYRHTSFRRPPEA
jgi:hypothetical protein